jgi:hypothetical protein
MELSKDLPPDPMSKKGEPRYHLPNVATEKTANEAFCDFGAAHDMAALRLKVNLMFDVLAFDQRARVLEALGYVPVQHFFDEQSGAILKLHRYYGFSDAGGLVGSFDGYESEEAAIADVEQPGPCMDITTDSSHLGDASCCVLSGEVYVARLRELGDLAVYGRML